MLVKITKLASKPVSESLKKKVSNLIGQINKNFEALK
jgi:hypothetical protein